MASSVHNSNPAPVATNAASVKLGMVGRQAKVLTAPEEQKIRTAAVPPYRPSHRRPPRNKAVHARAAAKRGAARRIPRSWKTAAKG